MSLPPEVDLTPWYWIATGAFLIVSALCLVGVIGQKEIDKPKPKPKSVLRFGDVNRRKDGY